MKLKTKISIFSIFFTMLALTVFPAKTYAQASCTGSACSLIPLNQQDYNQMIWDFKYQYLDVLMDDMGKAAVISNVSGAPIGTVNLSGYSIGANVAAGYVEEHKVNVFVSGTGTMTDIPSAGGSVVPRAQVGVNLGKFFGASYDPFSKEPSSKPPWYSPARLDVYLSVGKYKYEKSPEISYNILNNSPVMHDTFSVVSEYKGADVYYHIMEGKSFVGKVFGFLGLSAGLGVHDSLLNVNYFKADSKAVINLSGGNQVIWHGSDTGHFGTRVRSNTAEIKTGIRFLYFFSLTGAVGSAVNYGDSRISYMRYGRVYLSSDLAAASGLTLPDAMLTLNLTSERKVPRNTNYKKLGLELNFAAFKIAVEGIQVDNDKGASISTRFVF